MNEEIARSIVEKVESFSVPINELAGVIDGLEDDKLRKKFRVLLAGVINILQDDISYPIRRKFGWSIDEKGHVKFK